MNIYRTVVVYMCWSQREAAAVMFQHVPSPETKGLLGRYRSNRSTRTAADKSNPTQMKFESCLPCGL